MGGAGSSPNTLYFTAGINDETGGLFGSISVIPLPAAIAAGPAVLAFALRRATRKAV